MSSPIAKNKKGIFDKLLIAFHKKASHNKRVDLLSTKFIDVLKLVNVDAKEIKMLDIGCGDMIIAKSMASKCNNLSFACIDIYPNKENWDNYWEFDGQNIPFEDKKFDIALFSDVLHHDFDNIEKLLLEAKRVSKYIIIKDHFEYGIWSRRILQLADFIGNYGYGVSIPKQYFSKKTYSEILNKCHLNEIKRFCPVSLYKKNSLVGFLFKDKYQFISLIQ